jgi:hypothetical protein
MEEINKIIKKYEEINVDIEVSEYDRLIRFSELFYSDVAEIYDAVTRIRNLQRNPSGFNLNDAPILGLLTRIWKILKEVILYYKKNNANIVSLLDRQIIESAITAKYLLINGDGAIEDYRKCSYKNRIFILRTSLKNPDFSKKPAGVRLLKSIQEKLTAESLDLNSFQIQEKNNWKLSGKSFYQIFSEIEPKEFYPLLYGMTSESIHGSWTDSMDFDLIKNEDGTFSTFPFYQEADIRMVTPILRITHDPYLMWLHRIEVESESVNKAFEWIKLINIKIYTGFENVYKSKT